MISKKKIRLLIGPLCLFVVVNYTELVHGRSMSKPADSSHLISGKNPGVKRSGCFRASFKKKKVCLLASPIRCMHLARFRNVAASMYTDSQPKGNASITFACVHVVACSLRIVRSALRIIRDGAYDSLIPSASNTYGLPCG